MVIFSFCQPLAERFSSYDEMTLSYDEEFDNEDYYLDDEEEEELPRNPFRKKEAVEEETAIKSTRRDTTPKEKPVKTTSKKSMMRCATSTLSPSMLMTTVRPLSNVSVISISSSIELGFITSMMRKKKSFQEILSVEKKRLLKRKRP